MIRIIDNIPKQIADGIEELIFSSETVRWQYASITVQPLIAQKILEDRGITDNTIQGIPILEKYWLSANLYSIDKRIYQPDLESIKLKIFPLVNFIEKDVLEIPLKLLRIYVNMFLHYSQDAIAAPHIDTKNENAIAFLYYVNDSYGDTFFFNDDLTIKQRVSPKKGTGVLYDPRIIHAGSYPKNELQPRIVISFLFEYV